jgi:hypothetical protein
VIELCSFEFVSDFELRDSDFSQPPEPTTSMKPASIFWVVTLIALIVILPVTQAQLALTRSDGEIVVTSDAAPTWKIIFAVGSQADAQNPGGGIVRALHIPAANPESIVGPEPGQFCCAGLGLDNLEWRYIQNGKGVRAPLGTDATIDTLEITRQSPEEIVIQITGRWKNVPRFTRTVKITPLGFRTRLEADWDGPIEYRGMWWLTSLFRSSWVDNGRVTIRDEDSTSQILPVARGSVFPLPEGITFPYRISFPLRQGPRRELILRVASFGTDQPAGLRYELWPEEKGFVMFYPRWVGRPFERRRYIFDYAWTLAGGE